MGAPETVLLRSRKLISEKSAYNMFTYAIRFFILLLVVLAAFSPLAAQDNFSHRRIPPPENGTNDILNQFRMMQQLQQLMQQRDKSKDATGNEAGDKSQPTSDLLLPPGLDPSMLQQLLQSLDPKQREAVDQMAKQLTSPEGLPTPMLDQLKQDTEKIPDPKLRKKAQEMLDAYRDMSSEDRSKLINPLAPNNEPQPARAGTSTQQPKKTPRQQNSDATTKSPSPLPSPSSRPNAQDEKNEPLPNPFDYLNQDLGSDEKANSKPNPSGSSTTKPSLSPQPRRPSAETESTPPWTLDNPWEDRGSRQPFPDTLPSDRSRNSKRESRERLEQPSNEDKLPNVEDLLRQSKEQPESLPPLKLPPNVSDSVKQMFEQLRANQNPKSNESKFMEQLKGSLPPGLKEELRKSGVEQSMREVLQEARRNGNQSPSKPDVPPSLKQPPNVNRPGATDGIANSNSSNEKTKSWIEQITGQQPSQSQSTASNTRNSNQQNTASRETNGAEKGKSLVDSVTSIYKSMTSPDKSASPGNAVTSPIAASSQAESSLNFAWLALAGLAIVGLGVSAWMLFRTPHVAGDRQSRGLSLPAEVMEIS